jgi:molybdopterin-containing oxidoreductase family membrane subunit
MTISEIFTETYRTTHHSHSAKYLFFGLHGHDRLVPWIRTSIGLMFAATAALSIHRLRGHSAVLAACCAALFAAVEIEKGMGTIIPGFVPEPWGKVHEYGPTWVEFTVGAGIAAMGAFVFTVLAKVGIAVELGRSRWQAPAVEAKPDIP